MNDDTDLSATNDQAQALSGRWNDLDSPRALSERHSRVR